jgi:TMEM175 potassium channel family protein
VEDDRGRSAERLITFVDAVVAIAITLLALPLADIPREFAENGLGRILDEARFPLLGFAISFFVIARLWWAHHQIFAHVVRWDGPAVVLTILWLFFIVLLAPVTSLTDTLDPSADPGGGYPNRGSIAIYIGVMGIGSALLSALARHVHRHPELTDGHDRDSRRRFLGSAETTVGFVVALVIGTAFPQINYFALFVLALGGRIDRIVERRRTRRLNIR